MTDQYAVAKYREFFFAKSMGDRLGKEQAEDIHGILFR